jgi:hypothetical protein
MSEPIHVPNPGPCVLTSAYIGSETYRAMFLILYQVATSERKEIEEVFKISKRVT